jgi:predicted N-acetyltransferase YhbS
LNTAPIEYCAARNERTDFVMPVEGLPDNIEIRSLHSDSEVDAFMRLSHAAFDADDDLALFSEIWRHRFDHWPALQHRDRLRGAVDTTSGELVGGYVLLKRDIFIGAARVPMGGLSAVCVDHAWRKQGIGAALMWDAVNHARAHGLPLLLLTGVPNYYHRFGYTPVLELTELFLDRQVVSALDVDDAIRVRTATADDAPALLSLYRRQFTPLIGGTDRSQDAQRYRITRPHQKAEYLLASTADGTPTGYLIVYNSREGVLGVEMAAEDWPTIAALLRAHLAYLPAGATGEEAPARDLVWSVPPETPLFYELAAHVPFRSERLHHPSADWMACLGDTAALIHAMVPAWRARLAAAHQPWRGRLRLVVDGRAMLLHLGAGGVSVGEDERGAGIATVRLSAQAMLQLCFGYRPARWVARQPGEEIPEALLPVMDALFPRATAWVAASDAF